MARPRGPRRREVSPIVRVGAIALAATIVLGIVAYSVVGRTTTLEIGGTAETDLGIVTIGGWESAGDETTVSIRACTGEDGATADLSALRAVTGETEVEPSGSQLGAADGGTSASCVEGSVRFPTAGPVDEVRYLSSPQVVWRPAAA